LGARHAETAAQGACFVGSAVMAPNNLDTLCDIFPIRLPAASNNARVDIRLFHKISLNRKSPWINSLYAYRDECEICRRFAILRKFAEALLFFVNMKFRAR
jgi:hypothetical protein